MACPRPPMQFMAEMTLKPGGSPDFQVTFLPTIQHQLSLSIALHIWISSSTDEGFIFGSNTEQQGYWSYL